MDTPPTLLDEVERTLLGGEPRYTRIDVAERAGVSLDRASSCGAPSDSPARPMTRSSSPTRTSRRSA